MCDFKPGDEVVYVGLESPEPHHNATGRLKLGSIYTVLTVIHFPTWDLIGVELAEITSVCTCGFDYRVFRKVQRRNSSLTIEAFFTVPGGFEEPKRPAKTRERA